MTTAALLSVLLAGLVIGLAWNSDLDQSADGVRKPHHRPRGRAHWRGRRKAVAGEPCCSRCDTCPLNQMSVGQVGCLAHLGVNGRLRRRLAELGLTPGVQMQILQNNGGPVLISVRNSRLALGRETACLLDVLPLIGEEAS